MKNLCVFSCDVETTSTTSRLARDRLKINFYYRISSHEIQRLYEGDFAVIARKYFRMIQAAGHEVVARAHP